MFVIDPNEFESAEDLVKNVTACKVLIVDPVDTDRFQLKKILQELNYEIISIKPDDDVLEIVAREKPELIYFHVAYSIEANQHLLEGIKQHKNAFDQSPYIILTFAFDSQISIEQTDQNDLYDDICHKPYSETFIRAKLNTWKKLTGMQQLLDMQINRLSEYSNQTGQEMELAANIINNLVHAKFVEPGNIKHVMYPMELLSGDIFLTAFAPNGNQVFLIGDLTGHGLAAAVGAMVVYDVFYSMVEKGFALTAIAKEINKKLRRIQNTGRFMCSCLIELDSVNHFVHIMNAGLPDICVKGSKPGVKDRFKSNNIPLGILSSSELDLKIIRHELTKGDKLYVFSDGLTEVMNDEDECFGLHRVCQLFLDDQAQEDLFDTILNKMHAFSSGKRTDDITLVEITCDEDLVNHLDYQSSQKKFKSPMTWSISFDLASDLLQKENPLPLLLQIVTELQDLKPQREQIYTVMAEMFSNALEHGLLGLDSSLKKDADGFARYYGMRERLLSEMEEGEIRLEVSNQPDDKGNGVLTLALQHNGEGFDYENYLNKLQSDPDKAHGRGIMLINKICSDIRYSDDGRRLEVDYIWKN